MSACKKKTALLFVWLLCAIQPVYFAHCSLHYGVHWNILVSNHLQTNAVFDEKTTTTTFVTPFMYHCNPQKHPHVWLRQTPNHYVLHNFVLYMLLFLWVMCTNNMYILTIHNVKMWIRNVMDTFVLYILLFYEKCTRITCMSWWIATSHPIVHWCNTNFKVLYGISTD